MYIPKFFTRKEGFTKKEKEKENKPKMVNDLPGKGNEW